MSKSPGWLNRLNQWVNQRSLDALEQAYSGAKAIKMLEEQYFEGQKISADSDKGKSVYDYFQGLLERELGITPEIPQDKKQELLREKAKKIGKEKAYETLNGWKNILSDLTSLAVFTAMVYFFRRQFSILRTFVSRYFLGLSDVTKVFIFILLTDMFVGFHSAEGWEVILGSAFEHFGLPENHNFIFLFIATIPVILDSTFKLLIFNFFTRKSPTAVALLEKMQQ